MSAVDGSAQSVHTYHCPVVCGADVGSPDWFPCGASSSVAFAGSVDGISFAVIGENLYVNGAAQAASDLSSSQKLSEKTRIAMFHGVEVNYEAVVFVDWALREIARLRDELPKAESARLPEWLYVGRNTLFVTQNDELTNLFVNSFQIPYDSVRIIIPKNYQIET